MLLIEMASVIALFELNGPGQEKKNNRTLRLFIRGQVRRSLSGHPSVTALFELTHNREPTALREAELILL